MTDAGFEMIDYSVAVKYFSLEEIIDYWESVIDFSDIDNEEELEKFEKLISINYFSVSEINSQEFMQNLIE